MGTQKQASKNIINQMQRLVAQSNRAGGATTKAQNFAQQRVGAKNLGRPGPFGGAGPAAQRAGSAARKESRDILNKVAMSQKQAGSKNIVRQMKNLRVGLPSTKAQSYSHNRLAAREAGRSAAKKPARSLDRLVDQAAGKGERSVSRDVLVDKLAMDNELARAVIGRYQSGLPVAEEMFFKAAHAIGADPYDALLEARWETMLHADLPKLASGGRLSPEALTVYSAAAGEDPRTLVKTASKYCLDPQYLALVKLAENEWVPNIAMLKLALMAEGGGMGGEQMMDPMMAAGAAGGDAAQPPQPEQDPAMAGPQPGAAVQQQRYKPSPMAPMQTPPSAEGNLNELVEAARHPDAAADAQAAQQQPGGSMGPEGAPDSMGPDAGPGMEQQAPPQPQMTPDQKIQQVDPSVDQETMQRWAPKLEEIEQQTGIQMNDPAQVQKFIGEMQKADQKTLDEAIKGMNTPQPLNKPTNPNAAQQGGGEAAPATEKVAAYGSTHADMMTAARKKEPRYKNYMAGGAAGGALGGGAIGLGMLADAAKAGASKGHLGAIAKMIGIGAAGGAAVGAALKPFADKHQREATEYADDHRPGWSQGGARGEQRAKEKTAGLRRAYLP